MPNEVIEKAPVTTEDIVDLLAEDNKDDELVDDKTSIEDEKEKPKKAEEDDEEDNKEEDELELDEPEELKDTDKFIDIPSRKAILAYDPNLFKKFPGIEHAMYRDMQFSEVFPDPKDAEEAKEQLENLKDFESKVNSGSLEEILQTVKENNNNGFDKIKSSYLQTLMKVDERAYYDTIGHVINTAIFSMYNNGKELNTGEGSEGEQLMLAAQILNKHINGNNQIRVPQRREAPKESEEQKKLNEERQQFLETKLNDAIDDVKTRVDNSVRATVTRNIDPNDAMSGYVRDKAISDVISNLEEAIESDTRFRTHLDKLWKKSADNNFNRATKEEIKSAIFNKARTILPDIIRRVRADALKGSGKVVREKKEESTAKRNTADDDRPERKSSKELEKPNRKMSTLDYLMKD